MTQKEMVVRYMAARMGEWVPGYVLVAKSSSVIGKDYIIQDADTRAHGLANDGHYDSPHFRYHIEHRKRGKYAEFRVSRKEPKPATSILKENERLLKWFDEYPAPIISHNNPHSKSVTV